MQRYCNLKDVFCQVVFYSLKEAGMQKEKIDFFKNINKGKLRGSQLKLAKLLGISHPAVGAWFKGIQTPSETNIKKMSKLFKKSEEELQKIFEINKDSVSDRNFMVNDNKETYLAEKEIELLKRENAVLKKELEFERSKK